MRISSTAAFALSMLMLVGEALSQDDRFIALDKNRDGYLSRSEFAAGAGNEREAFDKSDENKDGRLNPTEFLKSQTMVKRPKPDRSDAGKAGQSRAAALVEDTLITTKVKAALLKAPELKSLDVEVQTEKGEVVLTGKVQNAAQRDHVVKIASAVDGVKNVKDALAVR